MIHLRQHNNVKTQREQSGASVATLFQMMRNESRQADHQTQNNRSEIPGFLPPGDQNIYNLTGLRGGSRYSG